jgi:hypothetical protein
MEPSVAAAGDANDAPYTHRRYLLADALGEVAALTGDPATAAAAEVYAENGLALQTADGENPELGDGDVNYQCYGTLLAERYYTVCPSPALQAQILGMMVKGLHRDEAVISPTVQVSDVGSTETGVGTSRSGTIKTIDYKTMIQAYSLATTLTGDPSYRAVANEIAEGLGWTDT